MNAITTVEPTTLLNLVARAAGDPGTDVAKMQALIELQERVMRQQSKQAFTEALASVAAELEPVKKDASNPQFRRQYATLAAIDSAVRPIYTHHGFSVRYGSEAGPDGRIVVTCILSHRDGHSETLSLAAPPDGSTSRTPIQAVGSSVSYLKRYLISMALNITFADEDDDGEASRRTAPSVPPMRARREPPPRHQPPAEPEPDAGGNGDDAPPESQLWLGIHTQRLESEQDIGRWLTAYEDACATASAQADLMRLHGIDVVNRALAKAPEAVKRRMTKASSAAFARLLPQPSPITADAETGEITGADRLMSG
jgi:hypothetical protein